MSIAARRLLFAFCLSLLVSSVAHAATTWVVDDNGVQCPTANFTTIQAALTASSNGDTIQICDGTYAEGTLNVTKEVTITGVNAPATLINVVTTATYGFFISASNVTVSNLTIQEVGAQR